VKLFLPKRFVNFSGFPEIASQLSGVTEGITGEESLLVSKVAPKQLGIIPIGPICGFRPLVTSWLDIELP